MIVPVRKDPEALPACHDRVDIHPEQIVRFDFGKANASGHSIGSYLRYNSKTSGTLAVQTQKPSDIVLQKLVP
jgi:hypothetical protein